MQQLSHTEYLFWVVAFSFYIADNIKLVSKDNLLVSERLAGGFAPLIGFSRYELAGKEIRIVNLLSPFLTVFSFECKPKAIVDPRQSIRAVRMLRIFLAQIRPLKWISLASFLLLLAGPILTAYHGFTFALFALVPFHMALLIGSSYLLIDRRKRFGLAKDKVILLIVENILVPAHMASIARRVAFKQKLPVDGYKFSIDEASPHEVEHIKWQIGRKLDSMLEDYGLEENDASIYSSYKTALGV